MKLSRGRFSHLSSHLWYMIETASNPASEPVLPAMRHSRSLYVSPWSWPLAVTGLLTECHHAHPKSSPYPSPKSAYYSIQFIGLDNISHQTSGCTVSIIITWTKVSKCCFASLVRRTIITAPGLKIKMNYSQYVPQSLAHGRYSVFGCKLVHKFNKH